MPDTAGYGYPAFYSPFLGLYGDRGAAFLGVMFENDQLEIAHVCPHGPAQEAGVLRGDRIVAIDQQRFENHAGVLGSHGDDDSLGIDPSDGHA